MGQEREVQRGLGTVPWLVGQYAAVPGRRMSRGEPCLVHSQITAHSLMHLPCTLSLEGGPTQLISLVPLWLLLPCSWEV